ncbi:MAG: metallophosphoesterase [Spirosomataceae bacterium]
MKFFLFSLLFSFSTFAQTYLITSGDSWKYLDNGTNQGTSWRNVSFNDASWASGNSELGYGEGDEATVVGFGPNASNKYVTTYFRKVINLPNTFNSFTLRGKRDDGVVVYFNGTEVFRDGLSGAVSYNTLATNAADDGQVWLSTTLAGNVLQAGQNTIAVEIHQSAINSSDISFDLELIGQNSIYVSRGPYLQMGTSNSMQIRWRTNTATESKINYGTDPNNLNLQVADNTVTTEHIINLTNLSPNTKYYYNIADASSVIQASNQHYFYTAPVIGTEKKTRIWATGDCGTGTTTQANVKNALINYLGNNYLDLWLLLGDNAYSYGYDSEYQMLFFEPYQSSRIMKQTPLFPAPGNHDYYGSNQSLRTAAYYQNFTLPTNGEIGGIASGTEGYYSYNYANIHFISLDSYGTETVNNYRMSDTLSPQITWLKSDLAANTQKWTILYWHHPPYTMGSHNSDTENELRYIREKVLPILERYKVDLILCGHSHNYERTRLIKGHYGLETTFSPALHNVSSSSGKYDGSTDSCPYIKTTELPNKGIVYVVAGSAGWATSTQTSYPHDAMYYSNTLSGGSLYLEIESNRLDAKWIAEDGLVKDQFTIMKDVNKKHEVLISTNQPQISLSASWIGNYIWLSPASTSRTLTINPVIGNSYFVTDDRQCLKDTFLIKVNTLCQNTYQIANEIGGNSNLKFEASQTISANGILQNGTNIKYDAGSSITLSAGFEAKQGAVFSAYIDGCGNLRTKQNINPNKP